ncbi:hypothetical protein GDO78_001356 [Eleutherodactylus coqui]|uniref:Uncharacterized protein n=1 Tax=Eleutherodactylus coqui TaxID=57060 RepID=A0A8J6KIW3_ELECQ|nr:hypothetical protein GDO78_001356 [Eleutherodactylus coqui]
MAKMIGAICILQHHSPFRSGEWQSTLACRCMLKLEGSCNGAKALLVPRIGETPHYFCPSIQSLDMSNSLKTNSADLPFSLSTLLWSLLLHNTVFCMH